MDLIDGAAYVLDANSYDRLDEVVPVDMGLSNPGRPTADGLDNIIATFQKLSDPATSHDITNVVIMVGADQAVRASSKALPISSDKSMAAAEYCAILKKTAVGWRIAFRNISPLP